MNAAERLEAQTLLNCYLRETADWSLVERHGTPVVQVPLPRLGATIEAEVTYRSPTARHQYALPAHLVRPDAGPGARHELGLPLLAALLADAVSPTEGARAGGGDSSGGRTLLSCILDSVDKTDRFLTARHDEIERLWSAAPLSFIDSEQALLVGHLLHPTSKSRTELNPFELARYSPELQGSFALRWFRVDRAVLHERSATGTPASQLVLDELRADPAVSPERLAAALVDPERYALVPTHPWEAEHLLADADLAELFASGLVTDVGTLGSPFTPTTSVRTVYNPDWSWMFKFSLHVRVTNSMRVTLPKELDRAVEAALLGRTEVGRRAAEVAPDFVFLHDPAYLGVRFCGALVGGFSVLLRDNRWPGATGRRGTPGPASLDVTALTTLCQDHPLDPHGMSRLGAIVTAIAEREDRPVHEVGRAWFARFAEVATASMVRLYLELGLTFEPHQQNTLIELEEGWPARCVYRDSQGYFHRELAHEDLVQVIPGIGEVTESIFPEALADERITYYLFINLTLGVVNALGTAGVADEAVLLADLRERLDKLRSDGGRYPATLVDQVLDHERLPCKANLRTRANDMDELVGDIATQSVYVTIPNPLAPANPLAPVDRRSRADPRDRAHRGVADEDRVRLVPVDPVADVDLVHGWMHQPHVAEFWAMAWSRPRIADYLVDQVAADHLTPWIAWVDDRPVAYVETYEAADDPLADHYDVEPGDQGWHVLVGPPDVIGTGVPRLVGRTVLRQLFRRPDAARVVCEPDVGNRRMIRFCQHLGHEVVTEIDLPDKRAALLVCRREVFEERFPR